jgi:hypothetical protein
MGSTGWHFELQIQKQQQEAAIPKSRAASPLPNFNTESSNMSATDYMRCKRTLLARLWAVRA